MHNECLDYNIKDEDTIFDLMFHGCQYLTVPMAVELLDKIKEGKIRGVSLNTKENN